MHVLWIVLTLILVIASFLGLIMAFFTRQNHFMQTCIGFGVLWVTYGVMLFLLYNGSSLKMLGLG